jgi:hypothetical protein
VTRELRLVLRLRHAPCARALSCLLLFLVSFNAAADVVHRHELPASRQSASALAIVDTLDASDQTTDGSTGSPLKTKDCPICQLHKHLSSGLVCESVFSPAPPLEQVSMPVASVPYLSANATPRRGRAPPQTPLV